ncbi:MULTISPECIES: NAD(P)-dependent alcohol dehydrogenase [unclassified Streptomyces]|uniref:NAD(P)-dependent alcohol dehydrogenase n=1 Tax=unclassified Streptomyces TaxID=2593676 RepID=UPI000BAC8A67|nr:MULTISPECIES: NAD(P)-dependent alcohol dehydrogenase [unclassified Streptomyces]ASY35818.1 alcohol dehydrogenase [Streptomyces sp. CLI2509]MYX20261.1 alcohol dehydrogenase catalytic domain-containing protein [Streptomyces sp. SID8380]
MRSTPAWQHPLGAPALERVTIERRELRADDLAVRVEYCGVCHSDLHQINDVAGRRTGPLVPGHEFVGTVTETGADVTGFAPGDKVAIGTIVDSCGTCPMCLAGRENYCAEFPTVTYGAVDRVDGLPTHGGYSREYVLREKFAHHLPAGLDPAAAAPLMCAGITVWEPLRAAGIGPGSKVAVAGLGGLGHLAVKLAVALGAEVTVLSRTPDKAADATGLGARALLVTSDEGAMAGARGRFDLVLDTISAPHDLNRMLSTVAVDGTLSVLGFFGEAPVQLMGLLLGAKKLSSSATGGLAETARMLEFCGTHGITADVEVLPSARVNEVLERLERGDVRYRFVLDVSDLDEEPARVV